MLIWIEYVLYLDQFIFKISLAPVELTLTFMDAEEAYICELAGISKKSLPSAYDNLIKHHIIEPLGLYEGGKVWKVFVKPTQHYDRDWLNKQLKKRYG